MHTHDRFSARPARGFDRRIARDDGVLGPRLRLPRRRRGLAPPRLGGLAAGIELPSIRELINEAPLKTLIALVSVWNLKEAGESIYQNTSTEGIVSGVSAAMTTASASTAVLQQLAEVRWEKHIAQAGHINPGAQKLLADALGLGSFAMLFQAVAAGLDVFYFGWRALDAY